MKDMDFDEFDDEDFSLMGINNIWTIDIFAIKNEKVRELLIATIFKNEEMDVETLSSGS
ncbi:MAG: hypothetical protein ACTSP4_09065 [Candidatus Hodarchaeales archaeon]